MPLENYDISFSFLTFLSGYGIFMGPVVAIMICEYFVVLRGNIFIPPLYVGSEKNEHYWFHGGWNIQAYTAYLAGITVVFPGKCTH
jgi:NCS1 family nucleobase:cation symporter-1